MQYPLPERIGEPELFTGRIKELKLFDEWIKKIPKRLSKSRVILARRKSGKTAIVQRIFNRLWSENGEVIPFYYNIPERKMWFPDFAIEYYRIFASQFISFLERDQNLVLNFLTLEQIRKYGISKSLAMLADDVDWMLDNREKKSFDLVWQTAYTAPHRYAGVLDRRFLVILDEFQNLSSMIYRDEKCESALDATIPGSWHDHSESKIAPMLVTGSYPGWMMNLIDEYFEGGRLKITSFSPYLEPDEGLQCAYNYLEYYDVPVTNKNTALINRLCMSDPFFISCVAGSDYHKKDLTTEQGVIDTVHYEITDRNSEMSKTWAEYINMTLRRVNDIHAKSLLLHLSKYADREWTPKELKQALNLEISENEIHKRLRLLVSADVIEEGNSDIDYRGLQDGTLYLILRKRFEKEISTFEPDLRKDFNAKLENLKQEKRSLQGKLNNLAGKFAEFQLLTDFRTRKRFSLSAYFKGALDSTQLNIIDTRLRVKFQRADGKDMEIDVLAESDCGRVILAEVKKTKEPVSIKAVQDFQEKIIIWSALFPEKKPLPVFLSVGGFTRDAQTLCREQGIGTAEQIEYYLV